MILRLVKHLLIVAVLACVGLSDVKGQDKSHEIETLLNDADHLLDQKRISDAIVVLDKAAATATELDTMTKIQSRTYLKAAETNLQYAQQLTNPTQYRVFARAARDYFKDYIFWCRTAPEEIRPTIRQIRKAVVDLARGIERMEELHHIFDDFAEIPVIYLSPDAIRLWKANLSRCPDLNTSDDRNRDNLKGKICTKACTQLWQIFADTLNDWAKQVQLTGATRKSYLNESEEIRNSAKDCSKE
jgi:hypothetical protein